MFQPRCENPSSVNEISRVNFVDDSHLFKDSKGNVGKPWFQINVGPKDLHFHIEMVIFKCCFEGLTVHTFKLFCRGL